MIKRKWRRPRKTGPCFPVEVLCCKTHCVYFTVYPPGHVPHAREAVVVVSLDGRVPSSAAEDAETTSPPALLEGTLFEAAWDAALGQMGVREHEGADAPSTWLSSQERGVDRAVCLVGVGLEVEESALVTRAETLDVDTLRLREGQAMIREKPTIRGKGEAVVHVLNAILTTGRNLVDRLLAAGHLAGLWGRPFRWLPGSRRLVPLVGT